MNAAFSFLAASHPGYPAEMAKGFRQADALNMWGMSNDEEMSAIYSTGADTIEIIKPFRQENDIFHRIEFAIAHGTFGVGMDIDHAFGRNGDYDDVAGNIMEPKTYESGADGVEKEIRKMTGELVSVMGRCGFATVDSIDDSVIWK